MNSATRLVVLDWNGTVLNDLALSVSLLNELLFECDLPPVDPDGYKEIFGFPIRDYYLKAGFDFSRVSYKELADRYVPRYAARYAQECVIYDGVREFLDRCRGMGIKTALLSVTKQEYLLEQVEAFGIKDAFDFVVGSNDHYGTGKAELAKELIRDSGVRPCQALFVGDTTHDHEVATGAGARSTLISHGHQSKRRLLAVCDDVVDAFDEIKL